MHELSAHIVNELQNGVKIKKNMGEIFESLICAIIASHVMLMCDAIITAKSPYELLQMQNYESGE